ncbi:MAG TPA: hypothetical protein PKD72_15545, partial [Gemmatales bacterium]|nr:hypothetical protein [Gemmatales bacterium]
VRNILGVTLALALLIPVPALGLTFLGSWRFFTSNVGGLPSGLTAPGIVDIVNDYTLSINMGQVAPPSTVSKYSITATRDFSISDPSELIRISHSFNSLMSDGNINVTMTIQRYGVANDPFNFPPYSFNAPPNVMSNPFLNDFFKTSPLTQGLYRLSLTLTYIRNVTPTSSWNNSSPHVFNFRRVP